jgi:putative spermidine/putrescine transport system ATP-binding protein
MADGGWRIMEVTCEKITKRYGAVVAVDELSLKIEAGEFVVLLGPSGCGKTTTLRLVAGLEAVTSGRILIGETCVNDVPPRHRDVAMVFQSYALYPHMTVEENIAYPLRVRKMNRAEIPARVRQVAELLDIADLLNRKPRELSGGQRQRVALARALINQPSVLLLDEPLGALDLKLREQMQVELKAIQRRVGITFIYVTHDQGEALGMSDRIAVFNKGRVQQIGTPTEIYERPESAFVAGFVGISNILEGAVAQAIAGSAAPFSIRPEKIRMQSPDTAVPADCFSAAGHIDSLLYLGASTRYNVALDAGGALTVIEQNRDAPDLGGVPQQGLPVRLVWQRRQVQPIGPGA